MEEERDGGRGRRGAPRPWLWVSLALIGGSWVGGGLASGFGGGARSSLVAVAVVLALAAAWRAWRRPAGRARCLAAAGLLLLVARGAADGGVEPARPLTSFGGDERAALVGRLEHERFGDARLVLDDGRRLTERLRSSAPWPPSGSRVALLPPFDVRPRARGPVAPSVAPPPPDLVLDADQIVVLERARGPSRLARSIDAARTAVLERALELPTAAATSDGRPHTTGLAGTLAVGRRDALDRDVADLFTRTGTRHLLALSGLHVGLFALLVAWPVRRAVTAFAEWVRWRAIAVRHRSSAIGRARSSSAAASSAAAAKISPTFSAPSPWPRRVGALVAGSLVIVFAALAGSGAPVVRASVVAVLVLLSHDWPRRGPRRCDALGLLSFALAIELATDPNAWRDVAIALSYGATLALAAGARPTSDLVARVLFGRGLNARIDPVLWLGSKRRIAAAVVRLRGERAIAWSLGTSIVANIGTLPALWIVFGEFAPIGLVSTPTVAPALLLWLPSLWLGLLAPNAPTAHLQAWVEASVLRTLEWFDALPGTAQLVPERPGAWLVLLAFCSILVLARQRARWSAGLARIVCVGWAITVLPWTTAADRLEVTVLDVGHGTCAVARAPGLPLVVFDAGSMTHTGLDRDALRPLLARIDPGPGLLVLSHTDNDHRSAVPWLATRCAFERIAGAWHDATDAPAPRIVLDRAPASIDSVATGSLHDARATRSRGAKWSANDDARWTLLRGSTATGNEGSYDLAIEWRGRRVLLFGDGTGEGLSRLVASGLVPSSVDLALLPHHGGFGEGVERWLDAGSADELWISAGAPADLVPELERRGLAWRATWRDGPLTAAFGPGSEERGRARGTGPSARLHEPR